MSPISRHLREGVSRADHLSNVRERVPNSGVLQRDTMVLTLPTVPIPSREVQFRHVFKVGRCHVHTPCSEWQLYGLALLHALPTIPAEVQRERRAVLYDQATAAFQLSYGRLIAPVPCQRFGNGGTISRLDRFKPLDGTPYFSCYEQL